MLKKPRITHESPKAYFQRGPMGLIQDIGEKRIGNDSNLSYQLADVSNLIVTKYTVLHKLHLGIQVFFN